MDTLFVMGGLMQVKALRRRMEIFLITLSLCILLIALAYLLYGQKIIVNIFIVISILIMGVLLALITSSYKKLLTAKLIIENRIMYIRQPQMNSVECNKSRSMASKADVEVYISCFGILMDAKVIKFNIDGVYLQEVELGNEYITFTYGTKKRSEKIRILHETMSVQEMIRITESFRYETGVTPVLVNEN